MSLLDEIVARIPVADVPELIVRLYLPGDNCLDDDTISRVFTRMYTVNQNTFLDSDGLILHSFNDNHAVFYYNMRIWYRNGKIHRGNDKPAIIHPDGTQEWWQYDNNYRDGDKCIVLGRNGTQYWSMVDRGDGKPVTIYPDGTYLYFRTGKLMRKLNGK